MYIALAKKAANTGGMPGRGERIIIKEHSKTFAPRKLKRKSTRSQRQDKQIKTLK